MQSHHPFRNRKPNDAARHILNASDRELRELVETVRALQARGVDRSTACLAGFSRWLKQRKARAA